MMTQPIQMKMRVRRDLFVIYSSEAMLPNPA
jgi:hypothetical protein